MNPDRPTTPEPAPLSDAGRARRDAMLTDLTHAMRRRHARLTAARRTVASTTLILLLGVAILLATRTPAPPAPVIVHHPPAPTPDLLPPTAPVTTLTSIATFGTDASALARYATPARPTDTCVITTSSPRHVRILDDATLLTTLDAAGRPTGLVRMDNRVVLTAAVIDHEDLGL